MIVGVQTGVSKGILAGINNAAGGPTYYTGKLPATIGELSGWTGTACWTVGFNFTDAAGASVACASMTDGAAMTVSKLTSNPTILTTPQAGWASQGGISVGAANELLFVTDADWDVNATIPTIYMATISMGAGPSSVQEVLTGLTGAGSQGWMIEALGASGLRITCMGTASSYVTGSTAMFDGLPHVIAWVIDDAAGKAKLFTEWGTVELAGLSYTQTGSLICTVGPSSTGAHWSSATKYFQMARGQNAQAYTNAASVVTAYNTALTTGSHPAAITGLPTTLAELNSVLGTWSATTAYNMSSAAPAPMTGSAGPSLAAFTGTMAGGVPGTAMTVTAAPNVKPAFTSQPAATVDSNGDNMWGTGALPDLAHTGILVIKVPNGTHPGSGSDILGINSSTTGHRPWSIRSSSTGNIQLESYSSYSGSVQTASVTSTNLANDGAWRVVSWRRNDTTGAAAHRICVTNATGLSQANSSGVALSPNALTNEGGFGRIYQGPFATNPLYVSFAMFAWSGTMESNANIDTAVNNLRWRYGL